jgi:acyl-coenzyme A thioesterase PaaI-like protein
MSDSEPVPAHELVEQRLADLHGRYAVPPPVFTSMQGQFLAFDADAALLTVRFPVLEEQLNPYGSMQGGMLAAAIDNALGPLSMLLAPPNLTRRLEVKYSRPATPDMGYVIVKARLIGRDDPWLRFSAEVRDPRGTLLARAQAVHWILPEQ